MSTISPRVRSDGPSQPPLPPRPAGLASLQHNTSRRSAHQRRLRNGIAVAAVLSVLLGALILAVPGLRTVAHRLAHASPGWIALALELASCVGYVVAFALVFPAPPRRVAAPIAWAEMGFGAVVPIGGAGGFALGALAAAAESGDQFEHRVECGF